MRILARLATAGVVLLALTAGLHGADDLSGALRTLRAVGPKGEGNEAASEAWKVVARVDVGQVGEVLKALDGANPLAANWIRTAIDSVCERSLREEGTLPQKALEQFVLETSHDPRGRRLAYEWLVKADPKAEERIVPQFLNDPSVELRREAVARLIEQGEAAKKAEKSEEAVRLFQEAFAAARDRDQVDLPAKRLKELGHEVDLVRHDGMIVDWMVIGPFDNTEEAGFDKVYPPETEFDVEAKYKGKRDQVGWIPYHSKSRVGRTELYEALAETLVDISEKLHEREVVGYASAEFNSPKEQAVQIRSASTNALKIWVNGKLVDEHKAYHAGSQFDQFTAEAMLRKGKNRILVKVCQNAQTQAWTEKFGFQLRVCDAVGSGILSEE